MTAAHTSAISLPPLANDRFLRACLRLPTDCTPVWLMRQAGRYLPEYRATRDVAGSFMGLATNPELACEVTLQPLRRYDLDAAILFSDILTVPDAMGLGLSFAAGEGPKFAKVGARRGRCRPSWPCPTWTNCAMCSTRWAPSARRWPMRTAWARCP
jgi:uroporphyrinogen decarboxylase